MWMPRNVMLRIGPVPCPLAARWRMNRVIDRVMRKVVSRPRNIHKTGRRTTVWVSCGACAASRYALFTTPPSPSKHHVTRQRPRCRIDRVPESWHADRVLEDPLRAATRAVYLARGRGRGLPHCCTATSGPHTCRTAAADRPMDRCGAGAVVTLRGGRSGDRPGG